MQLDLSQVVRYNIKALDYGRGDLRAKFATVEGSTTNLEIGEDSVASLRGSGAFRVRASVPLFVAALIGAAALMLCGCGAPKPEPRVEAAGPASGEEGPAVQGGEMGASSEPEIFLPPREPYRMTVGDDFSVHFFYYPNYNVRLVVRPDGMVTIPLVGEVHAEGMTPHELEQVIRERYAEVLAEPEVSVIITEFADQRVFVFGEVKGPGLYDLKGSFTVLDAVVAAGGITDKGRKDSIILIRQQQDGTFAGTRVNLEELLAGRRDADVYLRPGDVVYVPMTFIAKVNVFVDQFFAGLTPAWLFFIAGREVLNPEGSYIIGR
jgi:polysaccharide export outer membrane protein